MTWAVLFGTGCQLHRQSPCILEFKLKTRTFPTVLALFALTLIVMFAGSAALWAQEQRLFPGDPQTSQSFGLAAQNVFPQQAPAEPAAQQGRGRSRGGGSALADPWAGKKKLLIWADVQNGYQHPAISHAMAVIERLGRESGAYVSMIKTDSQVITKQPILGVGKYTGRGINAHNLDYYDAIFFLGSGTGTLNDQQKEDLLAFVHDDGKGFVGAHATGVAFYDWPEFYNMMGSSMKGEYPIAPTSILVSDPKFPGADAFSKSFDFSDQFSYPGPPYQKGMVHTIMRLDASKLAPEQIKRAGITDGDFPIVYARMYGKGRVFYSSFGHPEETWDDARVQQMYLGAIKWALGLVNADVTPDQASSTSSKR
jgi:type 1 glutamine amidotransferase